MGQAILPAAAFQAAFSDQVRILVLGKRRLKAGGWSFYIFLLKCFGEDLVQTDEEDTSVIVNSY